MYMSSDIDRLLFQLLRSMQLLLDYFGLEDKATMIQVDFACVSTSNYPYVYLRGDYMDCLYAASRHPGSRVLPASEVEIIEQIYRLYGTEYDDEYLQMIDDNRLVDRELRRRQKVRRKRRGRGLRHRP